MNTPEAKPTRGLKFYVAVTLMVLIGVVVVVEAKVALTTGTSINSEFLNKLLDTLIALLSPAEL